MKRFLQMLALITALTVLGTGSLAAYAAGPEDVIIGTEKPWLFFGSRQEGDTLPIYQHTKQFSEEELREIATEFEDFRKELDEVGIKLVLMIAPNKESIYGMDYMPAEYEVKPGVSCTDQLVAYLGTAAPELKVVYPKDLLIAYKPLVNGQSLYFQNDTHWNLLGGYYGSEEMLKAVCEVTGTPYVPGKAPVFVTSEPYEGDLQKTAGLGDEYTVWNHKNLSQADALYYVKLSDYAKDGDTEVKLCSTSTSPDSLPLKVFCAGDSFRFPMGYNLRYRVRDLISINRYYLDLDWLMEQKPDVLVYELVERYVTSVGSIPGYNTFAQSMPESQPLW